MSVTLRLHTLHVCESECEDARTSLRASLFFVTRLQGICIPMPQPRVRPGEGLLAVQHVHSCVIE